MEFYQNCRGVLSVTELLVLTIAVSAALLGAGECASLKAIGSHRSQYWSARSDDDEKWFRSDPATLGRQRAHTACLTDFGGVGDGVTSNTAAFAAAVANLSAVAGDGGAMLIVPAGRWLTGPFNLTSHFTLFLHHDAEILATQDINEWPIIDPLPSYGRGRDLAGARYSNFISGSHLIDVVITGDNGTINGQGKIWWDKFTNETLNYTRGYLFEPQFSERVVVHNVTFVDSPSWNLHPVYCRNVIISGTTVLAPIDSVNTDGIDPDSCSYVRIEDSFVVSGDDCIAIKSGWDEYGIKFGMPSEHIYIRRFSCISPFSAVIALGSELSGGIQDVRAENITALNTESAVRVKTALGRGAYVRDIFVKGMNLNNMKYVFWMASSYGQHPDDKFDPNATTAVNGINFRDVVAENVTMAGRLEGLPNVPFHGLCISSFTATMATLKKPKPAWNCTNIDGVSSNVTPTTCDLLKDLGAHAQPCPYPEDQW